jgi:PPOX class probable F420-dependent enzyme
MSNRSSGRRTTADRYEVSNSGWLDHSVRDYLALRKKKPPYNIAMPIPPEIHGQKYICLITLRKTGVPVSTPVWFGEEDDELYVKTRNDSGKYKRIRNNSQVRIAPCTMRGKVIGPEFSAKARILPEQDWQRANKSIKRKYLLARLPFWSKKNVLIAIENIQPAA